MSDRAAGRPLALVTGASTGIGFAFAERLAIDGYDIALVARDRRRLAEVAFSLPGTPQVLPADLAQPDQLRGVVDFVETSAVPVSLLVNNAGAARFGPFVEHDAELLDRMITLNVTAPLRLTRAALPRMLGEGRGGVITMSSLASRYPHRDNATYVAGKAFLDTWSRALESELQDWPITVTCVRPGWVRTGFHAASGQPVDDVPQHVWLAPREVVDRALAAHARGQALVAIPKEPPLARRATWRAKTWARRHAPDRVRRALQRR